MRNNHLPGIVHFGRDICGELDQAERREWWLANGLGAYAAGTIAGSLTRRYHGLLVAPATPPLGRRLLVAKADATLIDGDREWPLFTNRWADGSLSPRGYVHMESFRLDGRMPVWHFACGNLILEQRIWMEPGENTTYVAYRLVRGTPAGPLSLRVSLLVNDRDHHRVSAAGDFHPEIEADPERLRIAVTGDRPLHLIAVGGPLRPDREWIEHFYLPLERYRGLEDRDSHLRVGVADLTVTAGHWCGLVVSVADAPVADLDASMEDSLRRDQALLDRAWQVHPEFRHAPEWIKQLLLAADSFVFERGLPGGGEEGESVIAGYPWFGDWGRDTMIALPGLTLATGRSAGARRILQTFNRFVDQGMLPNLFPGAGAEPEYNTADAALWYIEAWRAFVAATAEPAVLLAVYPTLESIIAHYRDGTRFGIRMDPTDGLIAAGESGIQLTWMDAKVGDWVVTPRRGKPVEINALWYNALCVMADFAREVARDGSRYRKLAAHTAAGFRRFQRGPGQGLFDLIDSPEGDDPSVRPNQILAVSLSHSPLDEESQAAVLAECGRYLLCSHGLRTLSPEHPDYRGGYGGNVHQRDGAYHQGTVWAWLLGHYAMAEFRVTGDSSAAQARLEPIVDHLADAGLGTVSEIFDGDAPHRPRGAPAQAWSVACVLEAWWRLEQEKLAQPER